MSQVKFNIDLKGTGQWAINIMLKDDDSHWEIVSPNPQATIELPSGKSFYVYVNVAAVSGTQFDFYQDNILIFSDKTDIRNAFADYIIVHT